MSWEKDPQLLCFLIVAVCSGDDRNSSCFPVLAPPLLPVAPEIPQCSTQNRFYCRVSHPLYLLKENRQFGSKMTDSKYFTTTKKGMIIHICFIFLLKLLKCTTSQWRVTTFLLYWYIRDLMLYVTANWLLLKYFFQTQICIY